MKSVRMMAFAPELGFKPDLEYPFIVNRRIVL
jgi:hypothetical protein